MASLRTRASRLSVASVLLLLGCTSAGGQPAPSPSAHLSEGAQVALEAALSDAASVRGDVIESLLAEYPQVAWSGAVETTLTPQPDGRCVLRIAGPSSTGDLFTRSDRMRKLPGLLDGVLVDHGYGPASTPEEWSSGGGVDVASDGPGGWRLIVSGKGTNAYLTMKGPVAVDPCHDDALTAVSPSPTGTPLSAPSDAGAEREGIV